MSDEEGSSTVIGREPCPECNSSDNLVRYADGHAHCFSAGCTHHESARQGAKVTAPAPKKAAFTFDGWKDLDANATEAKIMMARRKVKESTYRRFGVVTTRFSGKGVLAYPYFGQNDEQALQKLRLPNKEFIVYKPDNTPAINECKLFGWQVWKEANDKRLCIFTGEEDAMAAAEATGFKFPCLSVGGGDGAALKHIKANYRDIIRYEEIVLWFDNDESGKKAAEECAKLFPVGRVKLAKVDLYKDASDIMQAGQPGDILSAIFAAKVWKPAGVVNAADLKADFLEEEILPPAWTWPWPLLNEMTDGIRIGETIYLVGGTGIGKSSILMETQYHLLFNQPPGAPEVRIGEFSFEFSRKQAQLLWLSVHLNERLLLKPRPNADLLRHHEDVFGSGRVVMFDPENAEWGMEPIMNYIRYMAKAMGCNVIFIKPLSFLAAGTELSDDERRVLDKASRDIAALSKELPVATIVEHHLKRVEGSGHEEGHKTSLSHIRGSGGMAMFASQVIGAERDQQSDDNEAKMTARLRVLKNRRVGVTGVACGLRFDPMTGRLSEVPVGAAGSYDSNESF